MPLRGSVIDTNVVIRLWHWEYLMAYSSNSEKYLRPLLVTRHTVVVFVVVG